MNAIISFLGVLALAVYSSAQIISFGSCPSPSVIPTLDPQQVRTDITVLIYTSFQLICVITFKISTLEFGTRTAKLSSHSKLGWTASAPLTQPIPMDRLESTIRVDLIYHCKLDFRLFLQKIKLIKIM